MNATTQHSDWDSEAVPLARQILVISDLHITPVERLGNFSAGEKLVSWTRQQLESADPSSILVLAGDILDLLLVEQRPRAIQLSTAPLLVQECLDRLSRTQQWANEWRSALTDWYLKGSRIVLVPGNHDPEWFH